MSTSVRRDSPSFSFQKQCYLKRIQGGSAPPPNWNSEIYGFQGVLSPLEREKINPPPDKFLNNTPLIFMQVDSDEKMNLFVQ